MSVHDAVNDYASRMVRVIDEADNKRAMCARLGIHHSTYYRWRKQLDRSGGLNSARGVSWVEQQLVRKVVAFALANPGLGPQQIADRLTRGETTVNNSKVWRVLRRENLNTRELRYRLLDSHRDRHQPEIVVTEPKSLTPRGLDAEIPGDLVQFDCFYVGSFKETRFGANKGDKGKIWQYTAIDVASSWTWVELAASRNNPSPVVASHLAHRVAADLTRWEWDWKQASTDNGNEFVSQLFCDTLAEHDVTHRRIKAGRPQSNGKVERVQGTFLQEFYQPTLIGYVQPSITGLRRDLNEYVHYYNWNRPHRGKWNKGKTPAETIIPKTAILNP